MMHTSESNGTGHHDWLDRSKHELLRNLIILRIKSSLDFAKIREERTKNSNSLSSRGWQS